MRIDVEGDLGALVSCQILHRLDIHARQQQVRNVSMPQDVGSDFKIDGVGKLQIQKLYIRAANKTCGAPVGYFDGGSGTVFERMEKHFPA